MISSIGEKIDDFVWGDRLEQAGRAGRVLSVLLRYAYGLFRDIVYGQLTLRSMSLVYTTLLSIVPLLAFSFSVAKGLGMHERLEPYLYEFLSPMGAQGEQITRQVMQFVDNVKGGILGGVSLAFFLYTAISMVQKVEESFNYVWYVSKPRSFARRFTDYVIVLLIGPMVMAIAIGIIASIRSNELMQVVLSAETLSPVILLLGKLTPYLLISGVFAFLYTFMPNTRVNVSAALIGGLAGGIIWASMGAFFTSFVVYASRTQLVYSGFAVGIVTLIWLYLNWLVLLIGAQIAFYVQKPAFLRIGRREPQLSNSVRERLALNVMYFVGRAFRNPGRNATLADISGALRIPTLALAPIVNKLESGGLLVTTEQEYLLPGRDIARISLHDVLDVVRAGGVTGSYRDPCWSGTVDALGARIESAVADTVGSATLADLLDEASATEGRPAHA